MIVPWNGVPAPAVGVPVAIALASVTVLALGRYHEWSRYATVGLGSFVLHVVVGVVAVEFLPYTWDTMRFHNATIRLLDGLPPVHSSKVVAFSGFQALLYGVFGRDITVLIVANALIAVTIPIPFGYLAHRLYPEIETTRILTVVLLFAPLSVLFLSLPMRDTLALLLLGVVLAAILRAVETRGHPRPLAVLPPLTYALWQLRFEMVLVVGLGCLFATLVAARERFDVETRYNLVLAVGAVAVGAVGFVLFVDYFPIALMNNELGERARGGAAYLEWMRYQSLLDVVLTLPVRALFFQFAPYPLHVNSMYDLLATVPLPGLVVLFVAAYRSLLTRPINAVPAALLVTVYLAGVLGFAVLDANFGTTTRHRIPFVFLLAVFATPVFQRWERSLRWFS
jgi:hypothetical protein